MFGEYTGIIKFLLELLGIGVLVIVCTGILALLMAFVTTI